jgi:hypothetical protein
MNKQILTDRDVKIVTYLTNMPIKAFKGDANILILLQVRSNLYLRVYRPTLRAALTITVTNCQSVLQIRIRFDSSPLHNLYLLFYETAKHCLGSAVQYYYSVLLWSMFSFHNK